MTNKTREQLIKEYIEAGEALWAAEERVNEDAKLTKETLIERETYRKASEALSQEQEVTK